MSQVNFFMLEADEETFLGELQGRADTIALLGRLFESPSPRPYTEGRLPDSTELVTIVHRELATFYPPTQLASGRDAGCYHYPLYTSACIDWSRCTKSGNELVAGRIYAKVGWLPTTEHNDTFRRWYAGIERWLKRHLSRVDKHWWVAPHAEAWSRTGGVLAFGPGASLRKSLQEHPVHRRPDA